LLTGENMKQILLLTFLVLISFSAVKAQTNPIVFFDENKNMMSVQLLNEPTDMFDCLRRTYTGTISNVGFDVDGKIVFLGLKTIYKKKLENLYFYLPDEAYSRLKEKEANKLTTLVKKNNRVKLVTYTCGEKATATFVDSIARL
jgi:hypothetical protein